EVIDGRIDKRALIVKYLLLDSREIGIRHDLFEFIANRLADGHRIRLGLLLHRNEYAPFIVKGKGSIARRFREAERGDLLDTQAGIVDHQILNLADLAEV